MKEPTRLCESDELPPALRAAFRSLDQGAPSAETAQRVQRALQALPPVAPGAAAVGTLGVAKLMLVTTLVVGGVTSVVLMRQPGSPVPVGREVVAAHQVDAPAEPTGANATRGAASAREHAAPLASPPHVESAPANDDEMAARAVPQPNASTPPPQPGARASAELAASPRANLGRAGRSTLRSSALAGAPRPNAAARTSLQAQVPEQPAEGEAQARAPEEPASESVLTPRPSEGQANEAALLAQAKRVATSDATQALRLVEALAEQYPHGIFVQERELLTIQLHQRLGHRALAEQLVRHFHERYPNSVYRRTLTP